jgi:glucokinase
MTKYALVGDVGGTNARLALCDIASGEISQAKTYSGLDYPSLEAVIRVYLEEHKVEVKDGCIAIACPITGDWVAMTNHTWAFSIAEMKKNLGFSHLEIINDFTAVSMAIPMLKKEHLIQFGGAEPVEGKPIAVYGAGTGLGVAHLVHVDKRWVSLPGEGGHVDFAPNSEEEAIILEILRAEIGHVSAERVLSGPGLDEMQQMVANQAFSTSDYFLLAVIKLAALVVAAASGFRGGRIFPAVFVGVALGLMLHEHVPAVPAAITVSCAILGIVLVVTRDGWLSLFMAAVVVPNTTLLPLLCIVMLPAWLLLAGKPMMMVNRPKQQPPHDNV